MLNKCMYIFFLCICFLYTMYFRLIKYYNRIHWITYPIKRKILIFGILFLYHIHSLFKLYLNYIINFGIEFSGICQMTNQVKISLLQLICARIICNAMAELVCDINIGTCICIQAFEFCHQQKVNSAYSLKHWRMACSTLNRFAVGLLESTPSSIISKIQLLWNNFFGISATSLLPSKVFSLWWGCYQIFWF